jgi:nucleoside phosphorylase
MKGTFRRLQLGLLVGVGGGAPSEKHDIRLGDVVVGDCGVIQYDMGKKVQGGHFLCTKEARRPSQAVLLVVSKLQARHMLGKKTIMHHIDQMTSRYTNFSHPGVQFDILYRSGYDHPDGADSCDQCEINQKVNRKPRSSVQPVVHYGLIASGNLVMRHGGTREQLQKQHNILCFEMEAAGVMDVFPCLVIRGICDYSDSHKNKKWQDYAAVTAAAYAKELLSIMHEPMPVQPVKLLHKDACFMVPFQQTSRFVGREDILAMIDEKLDAKQPAVLAGIGGVGYVNRSSLFAVWAPVTKIL